MTFDQTQLSQFQGSEGVRYIAEAAGAYWLLDKILISQWAPMFADEEFQVWKLSVSRGWATPVA
jgi:hypothetical protein